MLPVMYLSRSAALLGSRAIWREREEDPVRERRPLCPEILRTVLFTVAVRHFMIISLYPSQPAENTGQGPR